MAQSATKEGPNAILPERACASPGDGPEDVEPPHKSAQLARIAEEEHVENIARSRLVWTIGVAGATGLTAIELGHGDARGPWLRFLAPRLLLVLAPALAVLRCSRIGPADLRTVDATVYAAAAAALALIAAQTGGFDSPAASAVACVIVAQGLTLLDRPRGAALRLGVTMAVFAVVVTLIVTLGPDDVAGALRAPGSLAALGRQLFLHALLAAMVIAAGHTHWSARRTLAETRAAGRYVLRRCIGKGGMGEVWLGHLPEFQRDAAVKVLRADEVTPQAIARFGREVATLAELKHPNTVRVLDWGVSDGSLYYAMELLDGETLKARVLREGPLAPELAVRMARQIAQALAEAHEHAVIHRDLKPDNLFVTGADRDFVKVLDFGVAKRHRHLEGSLDGSITRAGIVVGTASYMAPEQVTSAPITPATDVYALGGVLFFMLTGRAPFVGPVMDVMRAQIQSPAPSVAQVAKTHVPAGLVQIVRTCLEKSPRKRFSSMLAVDAALRAALIAEDTPVVSPERSSEPPTTRRPLRTRPFSLRASPSLPAAPSTKAVSSGTPSVPTVRYPRGVKSAIANSLTPPRPSIPPT